MNIEAPIDNPLKILVISHGLELGGIERSLIGLVGPLADQGHDVDILLFNHGGELMGYLDPRVRLLPEDRVLSNLKTSIREVFKSRLVCLGLLRVAAKAEAFVARGRKRVPSQLSRLSRSAQRLISDVPGTYDLALSFQAPHDFVIEHVEAKLRVGWVHTDYTVEPFDPDFEESSWSGLDQIAAVSTSVKGSFAQVLPHLADRTFVVENAFDPVFILQQSERSDTSLPDLDTAGTLTLCTVGRFTFAKGFDTAIEACELLVQQGLPLRWLAVGYGPDEQELRQAIRDRGLAESFIIVGKQTNPYPFMAAADIYVQPSRYEGKAVAVREAQTLGKPVLITNYPTANSQLRDGVDGMICGNSPRAIAMAIQTLSTDLALRNRLAQNAAATDHSNRQAIAEMIDHLRNYLRRCP